MAKFLTDLVVKELTDIQWQLKEPFRYQSNIFGGVNGIIEVPRGFVTDFASCPIARQWAHRGAVIHDFLYQRHLVSKYKADRIFLEANKKDGIWLWKRQLMYWGVVFGGWNAYATGPDRFKILNK